MNLFKSRVKKIKSAQENTGQTHETDFYYKEISQMCSTGSWSVNFEDGSCFVDEEAERILKTPTDFKFSLDKNLQFYPNGYKKTAKNLFIMCREGKPFDVQIKMQTYDKTVFWAKAIGKPIFNESNKVVALRGIFQNIDAEKNKEIELEKSHKKIEAQNFKFANFAHIVSHKLRNQVSNLDMMLSLLQDASSQEDKNEIIQTLYMVSKNLTETTSNLSKAVVVNHDPKKSLEKIKFEDVLEKVKSKLRLNIEDNDASIYSEFSDAPSVTYFPLYLESIFFNIISNSIQYKSIDKNPKISIFSYIENGKTHLAFKDNGMGINMQKFGSKIFNMHQFLDKKEPTGTGLFITKSQVEEMDGTITIESSVGKGTLVTIAF